jgi:hypothetical protein
MEFQLKTFADKPGVIAAQQKFLNNLGDALSNGEMTEEDYATLPDWMRTGVSIVMGKKGSVVDVLTQFGDPTTAIDDVVGGTGKETILNLLKAASPAIKMPFEIGTGVNLFTGSQISENTDGSRYKDYPQWVKDYIGYRELKGVRADGSEYINYRVDPQKTYYLENTPIVAPYNTMLKRIHDVTGSDGDRKYLINILSGGRLYEKDLEREKAVKEKKETEEMNTRLIDFGIAQPRSGVYLNPSLAKNYPELAALLNELGNQPKPTTQSERQKRSETRAKQDEYINQLMESR